MMESIKSADERIRDLEQKLKTKERTILALEKECEKWKDKVRTLENETKRLRSSSHNVDDEDDEVLTIGEGVKMESLEVSSEDGAVSVPLSLKKVSKLTPDNVSRYSRQLLLNDGFGVEGQCKLLSSSVLVIGAGGIGSTLLLYLAASGVGNITVVDFDSVEMSNLHRQVIHKDKNVGMNKAVSACRAMKDLNPTIQCTPIQQTLTFENALDLVSSHDCIVDACDNPRTRYLINDACILAKKPLVSGSAMGTEGQLTVYGHKNGSCYRCLYPRVNPSEGCKSCSDNGVLGTVPGVIGMLQATEAIKVLTGVGSTMHDRLLMYDSLRCTFMSIKKQPPRKDCAVCSSSPTIQSMQESKNVSIMARGPQQSADLLTSTIKPLDNLNITNSITSELNISCKEYHQIRTQGIPHILLDVRVTRQYEMCSLDGSINVPLESLESKLEAIEELSGGAKPIYCICRRGIASAEATRILSEIISLNNAKSNSISNNTCKEGDQSRGKRDPGLHSVYNISGGLNAWVMEVDSSFPKY